MLWIISTIVFADSSFAIGTDVPVGGPQIQGGNVRIEFDKHYLRSRVIARFDKKETVMVPFSASETLTTTGKPWAAFLLASQKHERIKDVFGEGERLTLKERRGELTKTVSVTVYDDFPAMAFFDVPLHKMQERSKLVIKSWANNAYTVNAQAGSGRAGFLVLLAQGGPTRNVQIGLCRCIQAFYRTIIRE